MLKLHFAPNSRAVRTLWLLEELELPYELNQMAFNPKDLKSDEHRQRHPLGRIPVLEDGDDITIWESGAIAEYLLERHKNGGLKPSPDAPNFHKYLQWFHYCEGMVMPPMNTIVVHTLLLPEDRRDATVLGQAQRLLSRSLIPVNDELADKEYLAGEFTAADTMLGHALVMSDRLGCVSDEMIHIKAYIERLQARPAFQKAFSVK